MPYDPRLGAAFDFNPADLDCNRRGRLSPRQRERFALYSRVEARSRPRRLGLLIGAFVLAGGLTVVAGLQAGGSPVVTLTVLGVLAVAGGGLVLLVLTHGRRTAALADSPVRTVRGTSKLREHASDAESSTGSSWRLTVGGVRFQVAQEVGEVLRDGVTYQVHYLAAGVGGPTPLSVEPL